MMNFEEAQKDPYMPLRMVTLLYELYCDQYGLTLESIELKEVKK